MNSLFYQSHHLVSRSIFTVLVWSLFLPLAVAYDTPPVLIGTWTNYTYGNFQPESIAVASQTNEIFVSDPTNKRILKFDASNGHFLYKWKWGNTENPADSLIFPYGLATDRHSKIVVVADAGQHKIIFFDSEGHWLKEWGAFGSTSCQFKGPDRVAIDGSGQIYVADWGSRRIVKFSSDGTPITSWNDAFPSACSLSDHFSVAVNDAGTDIYIGDSGNHRILHFNVNAIMLGSFVSEQIPFTGELDLALNPDSGNLYVTDTDNSTIQIFSPEGNYLRSWQYSVPFPDTIIQPNGIIVTETGDVFINDKRNHSIHKFNKSGGYLFSINNKYYGPEELVAPSGIAVDSSTGNIFIVDQAKARIKKISRNGELLKIWGKMGSQPGEFKTPTGIAVDSKGDVFIAEEMNHRIQKFDSDGNLLLSWGQEGSAYGEFRAPTDVAIDQQTDYVYVAERFNHRIQKFDRQGNFVLSWGEQGHENGQLSQPFGVAVHPLTGNVYVADTANNRIQVFDPNGNFLFGWGAPGHDYGFFAWPRNLAIDSEGRVFVADTDHNRIQVFDSTGNFLFSINSDTDSGVLFHPRAVDVDLASGDIYVTASYEGKIHKFDRTGQYLLSWGYCALDAKGEFKSAASLDYDPLKDELLIADSRKDKIMAFDTNGNYLYSFGHPCQYYEEDGLGFTFSIRISPNGLKFVGTGAHEDINNLTTPKRFVKVFDSDWNLIRRFGNYPGGHYIRGIAHVPETDEVFITVQYENMVRHFDAHGNMINEWGGTGNGNGLFKYPYGIAFNKQDQTIFVADATNNIIQKFTRDGQFLLEWGKYGDGVGEFKKPHGLTFGPDGNLYVADYGNHRIQVFEPDNGTFLFAVTDGIQAPQDVTFDSLGNIYVINSWGSKKITRYTWSAVPDTCKNDFDCDGLSDNLEHNIATDMANPDTDNDGLADGLEDSNMNGNVDAGETDPRKADSDEDGLTDGAERDYWGEIWNSDLDNDGLINVVDNDSDNDSFTDGEEVQTGTDPADPNSHLPYTLIYEDAEDGNTIGWYIYDKSPEGAVINNVFDAERQSRVISVAGTDIQNGFRLRNCDLSKWHNTIHNILEWSIKSTDYFAVIINIETNEGRKFMIYRPVNYSGPVYKNSIYFGLGRETADGNWHTIQRNIKNDLKSIQQNIALLEINDFAIRGTALIDDIKAKREVPLSNRVIVEDAEDGNTIGWYIYDKSPEGAVINNVFDAERQSRVISVAGTDIQNGFRLRNCDLSKWHNTTHNILGWSIKSADYFAVIINIETTGGERFLIYKPVNYSTPSRGNAIYFELGNSVCDGNWHNFKRNIKDDLKKKEPDIDLIEVNDFAVRGTMLIDDIFWER